MQIYKVHITFCDLPLFPYLCMYLPPICFFNWPRCVQQPLVSRTTENCGERRSLGCGAGSSLQMQAVRRRHGGERERMEQFRLEECERGEVHYNLQPRASLSFFVERKQYITGI